MATVSHKLTLAEFESQFAHEKPYFEFWNGEAVQKAMLTWIHGLLQGILMELVRQMDYRVGSEVKLKITTAFQPVPDIIATRGPIEVPYPTKAVEIVIEILSDDDPLSRLLTKCRLYNDWGFEQIYIVDPSARRVFRWSDHRLEEVDLLAGRPVSQIWLALDQATQ